MGTIGVYAGGKVGVMNVIIAGYGYVGKAYYELLKRRHNTVVIDPIINKKKIKDYETDGVLICVSTPENIDGSCDCSHVMDVINDVAVHIPILIKSTISLDGWKQIKDRFPEHDISFSPEFLRASNCVNDIKNLESMYLSDDNPNFWATEIFFKCDSDLKFIVGKAEELILVKYFRNSFLATKVSFFNQVYDLCEATGISFTEVAAGITQDHRIGLSHSDVTPARGWNGLCFPKDTKALLATAKNYNVELSLVKTAIDYNNNIRGK